MSKFCYCYLVNHFELFKVRELCKTWAGQYFGPGSLGRHENNTFQHFDLKKCTKEDNLSFKAYQGGGGTGTAFMCRLSLYDIFMMRT